MWAKQARPISNKNGRLTDEFTRDYRSHCGKKSVSAERMENLCLHKVGESREEKRVREGGEGWEDILHGFSENVNDQSLSFEFI